MDTDELPELAPAESTAGPDAPRPSLDRRAVHGARRKARQLQRLYALGGLAVLAGVFAATVVVLDMVR